jgi:hypothetical protein
MTFAPSSGSTSQDSEHGDGRHRPFRSPLDRKIAIPWAQNSAQASDIMGQNDPTLTARATDAVRDALATA